MNKSEEYIEINKKISDLFFANKDAEMKALYPKAKEIYESLTKDDLLYLISKSKNKQQKCAYKKRIEILEKEKEQK